MNAAAGEFTGYQYSSITDPSSTAPTATATPRTHKTWQVVLASLLLVTLGVFLGRTNNSNNNNSSNNSSSPSLSRQSAGQARQADYNTVDLWGKSRSPVTKFLNPMGLYLDFGLSDAALVVQEKTKTEHLYISGMVALDPGGDRVIAEGDMCGQLKAALDNVDRVLSEADMDQSHVVKARVFSTNMPALLECWEPVYVEYMKGHTPPCTAVGTTALYMPELMVEVEMEAVK
jgi:enamine deaminase RidA (YjgF/YER057c/UK114 family)